MLKNKSFSPFHPSLSLQFPNVFGNLSFDTVVALHLPVVYACAECLKRNSIRHRSCKCLEGRTWVNKVIKLFITILGESHIVLQNCMNVNKRHRKRLKSQITEAKTVAIGSFSVQINPNSCFGR